MQKRTTPYRKVGAEGIEPPTYAGYRIYSPARTIAALLPKYRVVGHKPLFASYAATSTRLSGWIRTNVLLLPREAR